MKRENEKPRVSEGKPKYPPLRRSCREMDERGDGGYLVGGPSFELDVRRERERESERQGGRTDQYVAEQIKDGEITTELRRRQGKSGDGEKGGEEKKGERRGEERMLKV